MLLILSLVALIATVAFSQHLAIAHRAVLGIQEPLAHERGNAGKERILALIVDNFVAFVLAFAAVRLVPPKGPVVSGIAFSLTYLGYFFVGEVLWGRTIGKGMTGLRVVMIDGRRCTPIAAACRTLLRIVEVNPVLAGGLPAGFVVMLSARKQRLGDMVGKTLVVKENKSSNPPGAV